MALLINKIWLWVWILMLGQVSAQSEKKYTLQFYVIKVNNTVWDLLISKDFDYLKMGIYLDSDFANDEDAVKELIKQKKKSRVATLLSLGVSDIEKLAKKNYVELVYESEELHISNIISKPLGVRGKKSGEATIVLNEFRPLKSKINKLSTAELSLSFKGIPSLSKRGDVRFTIPNHGRLIYQHVVLKSNPMDSVVLVYKFNYGLDGKDANLMLSKDWKKRTELIIQNEKYQAVLINEK